MKGILPDEYKPFVHYPPAEKPDAIKLLNSLALIPEKPPRLDRVEIANLHDMGKELAGKVDPNAKPKLEQGMYCIPINHFFEDYIEDDTLAGLKELTKPKKPYWSYDDADFDHTREAELTYNQWAFNKTKWQYFDGNVEGSYLDVIKELEELNASGKEFSLDDLKTTFEVDGVSFSAKDFFGTLDFLRKEDRLLAKSPENVEGRFAAKFGVSDARTQFYASQNLNDEQKNVMLGAYRKRFHVMNKIDEYDTWNSKELSREVFSLFSNMDISSKEAFAASFADAMKKYAELIRPFKTSIGHGGMRPDEEKEITDIFEGNHPSLGSYEEWQAAMKHFNKKV